MYVAVSQAISGLFELKPVPYSTEEGNKRGRGLCHQRHTLHLGIELHPLPNTQTHG